MRSTVWGARGNHGFPPEHRALVSHRRCSTDVFQRSKEREGWRGPSYNSVESHLTLQPLYACSRSFMHTSWPLRDTFRPEHSILGRGFEVMSPWQGHKGTSESSTVGGSLHGLKSVMIQVCFVTRRKHHQKRPCEKTPTCQKQSRRQLPCPWLLCSLMLR